MKRSRDQVVLRILKRKTTSPTPFDFLPWSIIYRIIYYVNDQRTNVRSTCQHFRRWVQYYEHTLDPQWYQLGLRAGWFIWSYLSDDLPLPEIGLPMSKKLLDWPLVCYSALYRPSMLWKLLPKLKLTCSGSRELAYLVCSRPGLVDKWFTSPHTDLADLSRDFLVEDGYSLSFRRKVEGAVCLAKTLGKKKCIESQPQPWEELLYYIRTGNWYKMYNLVTHLENKTECLTLSLVALLFHNPSWLKANLRRQELTFNTLLRGCWLPPLPSGSVLHLEALPPETRGVVYSTLCCYTGLECYRVTDTTIACYQKQ
jgi:hypothetical protein